MLVLQSNILLDDKYMCPECNEPNTASQEFNYL